MAKPKLARKPKPNPSRADAEALALFLGALAIALAVSLYAPRLAGSFGTWLHHLIWGELGAISALIPPLPALLAYRLLAQRPLEPWVRRGLWLIPLGTLLLPLISRLWPSGGGRLGAQLLQLLQAHLGSLGLLLPLALLPFTFEGLLKLKPGSLYLLSLRRVALAGSRLYRSYHTFRQAGQLLGEVKLLAKRYPEVKALEGLAEQLEKIRAHPEEPEALKELRAALDRLIRAHQEELLKALQEEGDLWIPEARHLDKEPSRSPLRVEFRILTAQARLLQEERARQLRLLAEPQPLWRLLDVEAAQKERLERKRELEARLQELLGAPPAEPPAPPPRPEPAQAPPPRPAPPAPRRAPLLPGLPSFELLDPPTPPSIDPKTQEQRSRQLAQTIDETLNQFGIQARVVSWARGPSVTRFELEPAPGEKISRIANLANDLARALAAGSVRIEAPIPGKSVIGLEVPNAERELVRFSEALKSPSFSKSNDRLPLILGKSIDGEIWVRDLARMPHLLIAGSTGAGKSVAINTLLASLLFRFLPQDLRLLLIDPKMVELTPYEGIPHLIRPVVTNPADAAGVLQGAVAHMERRYKLMSQAGARHLDQFNEQLRAAGEPILPYLIIVIDELADLMITAPKEVEQAILRLAQMARATGMHLILATQRPSVDILTSLIKVNIPARMAFAVASGFDSRTILDTIGAERLIGQGDLLFYQPGLPKPVRLQGPFLSEDEVRRLSAFLREQPFEDLFGEAYGADFEGPPPSGESTPQEVDYSDPLLRKAAEIVVEEGYASVSRLQRRLSVGHARAGKLIDTLEAMGIVGPHQGSKPREVLVAREELEGYFQR